MKKGKEKKQEPPVPTDSDRRARERARDEVDTGEPSAPDGVSGNWP